MPSIKNFSSVTPIPNTNKVCVRYRRCRYFHNKAFIAIFGCYLVISLGVIGKLFILNGPYFEAAIVFFMFLWIPVWFLWDGYVTYRNRKIERSLVYPIIDKRLAENEAKYPSRCKVRKRRLIKEPKEKSAFVPEDETIVVAFANGEYCEYPFKYANEEDNDRIMVRELSLTQYVCNDRKKIAKLNGISTLFSKKPKSFWIAISILVVSILPYLLLYLFSPYIDEAKIIYYAIMLMLFSVFMVFLGPFAMKMYKRNLISRKAFKKLAIVSAVGSIWADIFVSISSILLILAWTLAGAVIPLIAFMLILRTFFEIPIFNATIVFITLTWSAFLYVYCPSYIRWTISKIPIIEHTEGNPFKEGLATFMEYVYDANFMNFTFNILYVVFVAIISFRSIQGYGCLISLPIDDAITDAFVVFLAFEGIRSAYSRIKLDSKTFLSKLLGVIK